MISFLIQNKRWLAAGLILTFGSSFGQTYFISLFAGALRADYGLSDGDWGILYTVATLGSAALLLGRGSWADTVPPYRLAPLIAGAYAAAAALMALGGTVWMLGIAVFLLRFCGQGMLTHIAVTAMARWFVATRGRALALTNLGYPLGEVLLPIPAVAMLAAFGWRVSWGGVAMLIALILAPVLFLLLAHDRAPTGHARTASGAAGLYNRHWTRAQAVRHWLFWALVPFLLTPGFIGTVLFFHQTHVAEVKGWTLAAMVPGYPFYAGATVAMSFAAGWVCDRFNPAILLPIAVVPMGIGMAALDTITNVGGWFMVLGMTGLTQGMVSALFGTLLPYIYGTNHLGAIRAVAMALMVFSTAIGPGITGLVIDWGVPFPSQGAAMAVWCGVLSFAMVPIARRLSKSMGTTV